MRHRPRHLIEHRALVTIGLAALAASVGAGLTLEQRVTVLESRVSTGMQQLGSLAARANAAETTAQAAQRQAAEAAVRLETAEARLDAAEAALSSHGRPVSLAPQIFTYHTASVPSGDEPIEVQRRYALTVDEIWSLVWATGDEPRVRTWLSANPGLVLRRWYQTMRESGGVEALPGTGAVLRDADGAVILITGYEGTGSGVSDLRLSAVREAKSRALAAAQAVTAGLWPAAFLDNSNLRPLSNQWFRVWSGTPVGVTDATWSLNVARWLDLACDTLPATSLAANIGHIYTQAPVPGWSEPPDDWAAQFVRERRPNLRPLVEHFPQADAGYALATALWVIDRFDRPAWFQRNMRPGEYADQRLMDALWAAYAIAAEPGSGLALTPDVGRYPSRHEALMDWLAYAEGPQREQIARLDALGPRVMVEWPAFGQSADRTIRARFSRGVVSLNTRESDGRPRATWTLQQ